MSTEDAPYVRFYKAYSRLNDAYQDVAEATAALVRLEFPHARITAKDGIVFANGTIRFSLCVQGTKAVYEVHMPYFEQLESARSHKSFRAAFDMLLRKHSDRTDRGKRARVYLNALNQNHG